MNGPDRPSGALPERSRFETDLGRRVAGFDVPGRIPERTHSLDAAVGNKGGIKAVAPNEPIYPFCSVRDPRHFLENRPEKPDAVPPCRPLDWVLRNEAE